MNSWNFTGNIGRDCESKYLPDGTALTSFSVAVKSGFGDKAATTWVKCTMFGKRGESVSSYLLKGQLVGVVGEVTNREWTDKEGAKRLSLEVRVNELTLLGRRDDSGAQNTGQAPQQHQGSAQAPQATQRQPQVNQYQQQSSGATLADMSDDSPF